MSAQEILIIGSSHARNMDLFVRPYFPEAHFVVVSIPGAVIKDIQRRMVRLLNESSFDIIIMLVGSNDISRRQRFHSTGPHLNVPPCDIAHDLIEMTECTMGLTRAKLVVCLPLPRRRGTYMSVKGAKLHNWIVRKVAKLTAGYEFVLPSALFSGPQGDINFKCDGVHLSIEGCRVLAHYLCMCVFKYM